MDSVNIYPLALPISLKGAAEEQARRGGTTLDAFILAAVAEKLVASRAAGYFARRAKGADPAGFDAFMRRAGGEPPRPGDEVPT